MLFYFNFWVKWICVNWTILKSHQSSFSSFISSSSSYCTEGQYHLQILNVTLEDDGPYECQVGRSVSSRAIVSRTVWLNVQSKHNHLFTPNRGTANGPRKAHGATLAMTDRSFRAANGCARFEKVTRGGEAKPVTAATFCMLMIRELLGCTEENPSDEVPLVTAVWQHWWHV